MVASSVNRAHSAPTVIFNRLMDFCLCVHHKRPVARDWFIQRHTCDEQNFQLCLCVCWIFDSYFVTVRSEHHHLSVSATLALYSKQSCSVNNVSEGVVVMRYFLIDHAARLNSVMQVDDR